MNRLRYAVSFLYWAIRHRSISSARWLCAFEGKSW
jgi:hypothetical protein